MSGDYVTNLPGKLGELMRYETDPDYARRRDIQNTQEAKIRAEREEYRKKQLGQGDFGGTKDTLG